MNLDTLSSTIVMSRNIVHRWVASLCTLGSAGHRAGTFACSTTRVHKAAWTGFLLI